MKVNVKVITNAKRFEVKKSSEGLKIYVDEKAENGKANKRLIKMLKKMTKGNVEIIKGEKSNKKILEIENLERIR